MIGFIIIRTVYLIIILVYQLINIPAGHTDTVKRYIFFQIKIGCPTNFYLVLIYCVWIRENSRLNLSAVRQKNSVKPLSLKERKFEFFFFFANI